MNSYIKKAFLIYILFLFSTLSISPIQANESSQIEGDLAFQQVKEQLISGSARNENTVEEQLLKKDLSLYPSKTIKKEKNVEKKPKSLGITPALIEIPAIEARAEVIQVGQTADGHMEAPVDIHTIGWYELGTKPGDTGNAVVAGHVDGLSGPGTFYHLKKLEKGDKIYIIGTDGTQLVFKVRDKKSYAPQDAPINKIFGGSSEAHLNLITCTGTFNNSIGHYEERLVIYADLIES